jgi:hypothetical protein
MHSYVEGNEDRPGRSRPEVPPNGMSPQYGSCRAGTLCPGTHSAAVTVDLACGFGLRATPGHSKPHAGESLLNVRPRNALEVRDSFTIIEKQTPDDRAGANRRFVMVLPAASRGRSCGSRRPGDLSLPYPRVTRELTVRQLDAYRAGFRGGTCALPRMAQIGTAEEHPEIAHGNCHRCAALMRHVREHSVARTLGGPPSLRKIFLIAVPLVLGITQKSPPRVPPRSTCRALSKRAPFRMMVFVSHTARMRCFPSITHMYT